MRGEIKPNDGQAAASDKERVGGRRTGSTLEIKDDACVRALQRSCSY